MKKIITAVLLCATISMSLFAQKKADIVFIHDVHSFLKDLPKAKTLIDRQKAKNPDTIVVDGGDFSMGTLYQTIFETQASEFRTLGKLGFDASTIGNHEFDYGAQSLSNMFDTALNSGDPLPQFVLCNVDWTKDNEYTKIFKASMDRINNKDYIMLKKGDLNVAVIGVFGADAFFCSPTCELTFTDQYEAVKRTVATIKANEKADLIICLSHSGTWDDPKKSEDEILAKKVPELDVIISAHTHTVLEKPIIKGETIIASCGAYSQYLGNISLTQKPNGRWQLDEYRLDSLKADIEKDPDIEKDIAGFDISVDEEYLSLFGYTSNQILSKSDYTYDINHEVGYLMADAIYDTVESLGTPVDVVVVPEGVTRGTYQKGDVIVSDVFESYSLGIGPDKLTGYPLIDMYFTGKEMIEVAEIDCSLSGFISYVRLYTSGVTYKYNPRRLILDKVTDVYITKRDGTKELVDPNKLYRVVTDMYTGQMIGSILDMTFGLISVVPKDKNGNPITDWNNAIIHDLRGNEQKGWLAIAASLGKMETLPSYAEAEKTAIIAEPSLNPVSLLKHPSKVGIILRVVILVLILLLALIVFLIVRGCKKRKSKKNNK